MRQVRGRVNLFRHLTITPLVCMDVCSAISDGAEAAFDVLVKRGLRFLITQYNITMCGTFHAQHRSLGYNATH